MSRPISFWLYLAACLLLPTLWGAATAFVFAAIEARREKHGTEDTKRGSDAPPWGYEI